jgi:acetylornithine deacetylase/succinyl-diaminopimelate desuccinylase-like protein
MFDPVSALTEFVRFPSVSADPTFAEGMVGAREWLTAFLDEMGFETREVRTSGHPAVIAHRRVRGEAPKVVIYGHYDVQPPDPLGEWTSPPFEAEVRGGRLYGRGAADNKGGLMAHLAGVKALLERRPDLPLNITFFVEGEEEVGSPSFLEILDQHGDELKGDFFLLSDTMSPNPETLGVTVALRGMVTMELTVEGPSRDLHSGLFGGAVYNPLRALMEIGASLHTPDGRVNVPGFYDKVVDVQGWERDEIARLGNDPAVMRESIGIPEFAAMGDLGPDEVTRLMPTLEFNGMGGGYQGKGDKTIIPARAFAKISCRLVANQDPVEIFELVRKALQDRCPPGVRLKVEEGHHGPAYRVVPPGKEPGPSDQNPHLVRAFAATEAAALKIFGALPLYLREGGSIPIIGELKRVLGMDALMVGIFTADDRHHAPDESLHLGLLEKGIKLSQAILEEVADGR